MDPKVASRLEREMEKAIIEIVIRLGLKKLPLLPAHQTIKMMASCCLRVPGRGRSAEEPRGGVTDGVRRILAERVRQPLARKKGINEKKMFGGIGFLLNGNMLVGVWKDSLIARLGPEQAEEALEEPHVGEFDITGRPMKGWVLVEPSGVEDDDQLKDWIRAGSEVCRQAAGEVAVSEPAVKLVPPTRLRTCPRNID